MKIGIFLKPFFFDLEDFARHSVEHMTILVIDQDEAMRFYTEKLGFKKCQDTMFCEGMRWVTVPPKNKPDWGVRSTVSDGDAVKSIC